MALMSGSQLDKIISIDAAILGGVPVFRGTRVPIDVLFDNLADGMSVDEILDQYPTLDRSDVLTVLHQASDALTKVAV